MNGTLTDVPGIRVGHAQDIEKGITGCTVILCPPHNVSGVDQRGGAPGTRETDALRPMHLVPMVHAIFLAGGSAFGLSVGDGVMHYLEEQGVGVTTSAGKVPIVAGAILFDLDVGDPLIRPDAAMGYQAAGNASAQAVLQGSIGAGTGAKVGGMLGKAYACKGGIGSASMDLGDGLIVAALFAVNPVGDVVDEAGQIVAGARLPDAPTTFADSLSLLKARAHHPLDLGSNTVIGVVATTATLSKEDVNKVAQMAQDGLARAVRPAHTPFDGDTIFAVATGEKPANVAAVGAIAAEVSAQAIRNAVRSATPLGGLPTSAELLARH